MSLLELENTLDRLERKLREYAKAIPPQVLCEIEVFKQSVVAAIIQLKADCCSAQIHAQIQARQIERERLLSFLRPSVN